MVTGELKNKIDRLWDAFWSGGISNPLEVIEQITYLMFIRRLDQLQQVRERKANRTAKPVENPIYTGDTQHLRWSVFPEQGPRRTMLTHTPGRCLPMGFATSAATTRHTRTT
ncbi:type I restriction-modification system subunit M N-terminal domain-containing protein [Saccharopolyspora antimicrobica]|uniref:type I restriction-modification system subunit M N-terminal domain-containing protein n=1 Tax=Saccharopolyspora antimicrobica TaxID=455193 RepID=UPI001BA66A08|nr:type I restriction-modification system subunit M N-terminal domain-containing protein [Saccharopolyspora antimicrobica]